MAMPSGRLFQPGMAPRDRRVLQRIVAVGVATDDHLRPGHADRLLVRLAAEDELARIEQPRDRHLERAEEDHVGRLHLGPLDAIARLADGRAIGRAQIFEDQPAALAMQPRVIPRDHRVVDDDVGFRRAPDRDDARGGGLADGRWGCGRPREANRGRQDDRVGRRDPFRLADGEAFAVDVRSRKASRDPPACSHPGTASTRSAARRCRDR